MRLRTRLVSRNNTEQRKTTFRQFSRGKMEVQRCLCTIPSPQGDHSHHTPHINHDIVHPDTMTDTCGSWSTSWTWCRTRRPCQWQVGWLQPSQRSLMLAKSPPSRDSLLNWLGLQMNCPRDISSSRLSFSPLRSFQGVFHPDSDYLFFLLQNSHDSISSIKWKQERKRTQIKIDEN